MALEQRRNDIRDLIMVPGEKVNIDMLMDVLGNGLSLIIMVSILTFWTDDVFYKWTPTLNLYKLLSRAWMELKTITPAKSLIITCTHFDFNWISSDSILFTLESGEISSVDITGLDEEMKNHKKLHSILMSIVRRSKWIKM